MVSAAEVAPTTQNPGNQLNQSTAISRIDVAGNMLALASGNEQSILNIQNLGKMLAESRMLKLKNPQQGSAVVLAAICEGITPFQLMKEYHVMDDGGMSMKADVMLAKFNAAGGKHTWMKTGDDGEEAVLRLTWNGQSVDSVYTIEDAKRANLIRKGGNWEKNPGEMLRARATSKGVRMVMPGIVAGIYCPEDFPEQDDRPVTVTTTATRSRSSKSAAANAAASVANNGNTSTNGNGEQGIEVIDVTPESSVEVVASNGASVADEGSGDAYETTILLEIEAHINELGKTKLEIEKALQAKNPAIKTIDDMPLEAQQKLLESLRANVAAKNEVPFN